MNVRPWSPAVKTRSSIPASSVQPPIYFPDGWSVGSSACGAPREGSTCAGSFADPHGDPCEASLTAVVWPHRGLDGPDGLRLLQVNPLGEPHAARCEGWALLPAHPSGSPVVQKRRQIVAPRELRAVSACRQEAECDQCALLAAWWSASQGACSGLAWHPHVAPAGVSQLLASSAALAILQAFAAHRACAVPAWGLLEEKW